MNEAQEETNYFRTSELPLVVTLSLFFPIDLVDKTSNPKRIDFLFKRSNNLDQVIEAYWRRELKIEPQAYFAQIKFVKSRLYSQQQ